MNKNWTRTNEKIDNVIRPGRYVELFERLGSDLPAAEGVRLAHGKPAVEIHGGRIWVDSQKDGQSCCFCFTLPTDRGT